MPSPTNVSADGPVDLAQVLDDELTYLERHRSAGRGRGELRRSLVGLALSGGGIRSATTNLGILQALARMDILPMVDYVSTVSGGGYIGAALSAYLSMGKVRMTPDADVVGGLEFERQLRGATDAASSTAQASGQATGGADPWARRLRFGPSDGPAFGTEWLRFPFRAGFTDGRDVEPRRGRLGADLVAHLRTHGHFLVLRRGLLRRETMRSIGTLVTGIVYNFGLFLLTVFTAVALYLALVLTVAPGVPRAFGWGPGASVRSTDAPGGRADRDRTTARRARDVLVAADSATVRTRTAACAPGAAGCTVETEAPLGLRTAAWRVGENVRTVGRVAGSEWDSWRRRVTFVSPVAWARRLPDSWTALGPAVPRPLRPLVWGLLAGALVTVGMFIRLCLTLRGYEKGREPASGGPSAATRPGDSDEDRRERRTLQIVAVVFALTIVAVLVVLRETRWGLGHMGLPRPEPGDAHTPVDLLVWQQATWLFVPLAVLVGARVTSALLAVTLLPHAVGRTRRARSRWGAVQAITIYGGWAMLAAAVLPLIVYALPGGATGTGIGALGSVALTRFLSSRLISREGGRRTLPPGVRRFALGVAVALVLALTVLFCGAVIATTFGAPGRPISDLWILVAVLATGFALFGFVVDQNAISPHYFYRDRLAETYLQAEIPDTEQRMRLFHDAMEMPLHWLHGLPESYDDDVRPALPLDGWTNPAPYHLVSAAINLAGSRDLTRKDRKSGYWLFSKLYCGSKHTGFAPTNRYRDGETKLARAVAISGAAASAGAGFNTFFAQAFAATLFNVRLGNWMENPRRLAGRVRGERLAFWPAYLWKEVIMDTSEHDLLVNLSDGGHTGDNVGIYPLLQRRCKVIIACDAERDPALNFGSFTEALRHAYIDMGIEVDIDLAMIRLQEKTGLSQSHCALGRIHYPDRPDQKSYLIYLKNSLTGDEQEPVLNYRSTSPVFPHESTADLFFGDAQFESYRALGVHIAETTFAEWVSSRPFAFARDYHAPAHGGQPGGRMSERQTSSGAVPDGWRFLADGAAAPTRSVEAAPGLDAAWQRLLLIHTPFKAADQDVFLALGGVLRNVEQVFLGQHPMLDAYYDECFRDEPGPPPTGPSLNDPRIRHVVMLQAQLMEDVYYAFRLDRYANAPENRGWMNLFRRWGRSRTFDDHFARIARTFSAEFAAFYQLYVRCLDTVDRQPVPHHWDPEEERSHYGGAAVPSLEDDDGWTALRRVLLGWRAGGPRGPGATDAQHWCLAVQPIPGATERAVLGVPLDSGIRVILPRIREPVHATEPDVTNNPAISGTSTPETTDARLPAPGGPSASEPPNG